MHWSALGGKLLLTPQDSSLHPGVCLPPKTLQEMEGWRRNWTQTSLWGVSAKPWKKTASRKSGTTTVLNRIVTMRYQWCLQITSSTQMSFELLHWTSRLWSTLLRGLLGLFLNKLKYEKDMTRKSKIIPSLQTPASSLLILTSQSPFYFSPGTVWLNRCE